MYHILIFATRVLVNNFADQRYSLGKIADLANCNVYIILTPKVLILESAVPLSM